MHGFAGCCAGTALFSDTAKTWEPAPDMQSHSKANKIFLGRLV